MTSGLSFRDIAKSFGAVKALDGVSFDVARGDVHALVGENGAGKSTLLKVLAGIVQPDRGTLAWNGEPLAFGTPRQALERGVGMVYQETLAFPNLSVAANIFAGREITSRFGRLDEAAMARRTQELLDELHIPVRPDTPMELLPAALSQLVQVARALAFDCSVLVLDEPTTSLTDAETDHLFAVVERLTARGLTVLFVSHRIPEVFRLCHRITVLRDGHHAGTFERAAVTPDDIVRAMVGRETPQRIERVSEWSEWSERSERSEESERSESASPPAARPVRLKVAGLSGAKFRDVSLEVRAGEVVAIFGLVGSGRSELVEAIFGVTPAIAGRVEVDGIPATIRDVPAAARAGLALVPEDRQKQGLFFNLSQRDNIALPKNAVRGAWRIDAGAEAADADWQRRDLGIKTASLDFPPDTLSGGNQQKIVVAKWLATSPHVLLLDEPTKGVDVGAKFEIHGIIRREADAGMACLMVSSDLPEVLSLADRIIVMREGRVRGELVAASATDDQVMRLATHEATA